MINLVASRLAVGSSAFLWVTFLAFLLFPVTDGESLDSVKNGRHGTVVSARQDENWCQNMCDPDV
ncbi:hypothetical protein RRG08_053923 [Elysia crispata]|uniref:Uncharacterized protein n=1 Tax=Elysia crispata TaxID=231223 RepID=A0AAE0YT03_9GAST|nr:hypothetical protein RRG08_053923 [Elysia crispata]